MEIGSKDQKYIFGAYINMAYNNFLLKIRQMARKMNLDIQSDNLETLVSKTFKKNCVSPNVENIVGFYFPWMKYLVDKLGFNKVNLNLNDIMAFYKAVIGAFAIDINNCRNYYTHKYHSEWKKSDIEYNLNSKKEICPFVDALDIIYDGAVTLVKERFMASECDVKHLYRCKLVGKNLKPKTQ